MLDTGCWILVRSAAFRPYLPARPRGVLDAGCWLAASWLAACGLRLAAGLVDAACSFPPADGRLLPLHCRVPSADCQVPTSFHSSQLAGHARFASRANGLVQVGRPWRRADGMGSGVRARGAGGRGAADAPDGRPSGVRHVSGCGTGGLRRKGVGTWQLGAWCAAQGRAELPTREFARGRQNGLSGLVSGTPVAVWAIEWQEFALSGVEGAP